MKQDGIEKLIRPELIDFGGYAASKSPESIMAEAGLPAEDIIKLDANENPYGCSPKVNRALASYPDINIYPDSGQIGLRRKLQEYSGVSRFHRSRVGLGKKQREQVSRITCSLSAKVVGCRDKGRVSG